MFSLKRTICALAMVVITALVLDLGTSLVQPIVHVSAQTVGTAKAFANASPGEDRTQDLAWSCSTKGWERGTVKLSCTAQWCFSSSNCPILNTQTDTCSNATSCTLPKGGFVLTETIPSPEGCLRVTAKASEVGRSGTAFNAATSCG